MGTNEQHGTALEIREKDERERERKRRKQGEKNGTLRVRNTGQAGIVNFCF